MPNTIRTDLHHVDETSYDYIFEKNATVELKDGRGLVRCNVYRPKGITKGVPVLVTYGPYGKDVHYSVFHASSFNEVPEEHHSPHSAWETPDPGFWTGHGYAIVRGDEVGTGQSPGELNTMSRDTSLAFKDLIEWAASQSWSSGKVGLLGISYYAGSQWRVAARQPIGLECIIPWEGMADYYRDRCRHGGILADKFIDFWWNRQVITNQYGRPGRAARRWGDDTLEGDLPEDELKKNCHDQTVENASNHFLDDEYYASRDYNFKDIKVPMLSVANWGGITLHLRGNIEGFLNAGSEFKYLRFITGRHDLPFYYKEEVEMQKSFLDAFLKGQDSLGWKKYAQPRVQLVLRRGNVGFNNPEAEKAYLKRPEEDWPIPRTIYTRYYLTHTLRLTTTPENSSPATKITYQAPGSLNNQQLVTFKSRPFEQEVEFTGHIIAHLNVSATSLDESSLPPSELDLFLTIRHLDADGKEVFYTGAVGDPVPVSKGWLRVSLRKVNEKNARHTTWHPYRDYLSTDVEPIEPGKIYDVDAEIWPTNVVMLAGDILVFEIAAGDTQGSGIFEHNSPYDRPHDKFRGLNHVHFGAGLDNYLLMPVIPSEESA